MTTKSSHQWATMALVAVMAAFGTVLAMTVVWMAVSALDTEPAIAQFSSEASADYVAAVLGPEQFSRVPLFLVDTKAQSIMVYEWDAGRRRFYLRAVRSFRNDRRIEDAHFAEQRLDVGPSVEQAGRIAED